MSPRRTDPRLLGRLLVVVTCSSILLVASAVLAAGTIEPVRDRRGVTERDPAASQGYLAWGQASGRGYDAFVKPDEAPRVQMNRTGTESFAVGIDGTTAVFDLDDRSGDDLDLRMFEVLSQTRSNPVAGVNTDNSEYQPALSGDWLFFTRNTAPTRPFRRTRVQAVLFNTSTSEQRVLMSARLRNHFLLTDQVNGDWATFETCDIEDGQFTNCQVWVYRISTETLTRSRTRVDSSTAPPSPGDGTVYFVRSGNADHWLCGKNVQIVRLPDGGSEQLIGTIPDGKDVFASFALEEADTSTTLLFDRLTCSRQRGGIYEIADAAT
jgi:hypothetical protein